MKKLGFALGAGGSRGVAHIGFLRAMEEEGIFPDYISGTSMGAVVGACYASGFSPDYMAEIVKKIKFSDIFDLSVNPLGNAALLRAQKMQKLLKKHLGENKFADLKIPFKCVATNLIAGKAVILGNDENEEVYKCVAASSSIPSIFKPIQRGNAVLVDGGLCCRVPIRTVREMGADVIVAVDVLGKVRPLDKKFNLISLLFRSFEIADCELVSYKVGAQKPDIFIEPDLGDMVQYKFKNIENAIEIGYSVGKEYAPKIKELLEQ